MKKSLGALVSFVLIYFLLIPSVMASDQTKIEYLITTNRPSWERLIDTLNQDIYENYRIPSYYGAQNLRGKQLNKDLYTMRCLMVYGTPQDIENNELKNGRYRFFGQTMNGEAYVNELFPMDAWSGGYLNDRNWVPEPWKHGVTYRGGAIKKNDITTAIDSDPTLRQKINAAIHTGLTVFYGNKRNAASSNPFDKIYDETRGATTDWAQYVHIIQPPTEYTWGMGVMFHSLNGKYWYKTVPIAPFALELPEQKQENKPQPVIDLIAQQGEYNPALMVGEKDTYSVLIKNTGDVAVTTDLVWRQDGKQIKKISITIPAKGYKEHAITFTMPNVKEGTTIKLEAEINPGRNKPKSEKTFANNKVTFPIRCLGLDQRKQTGGSNPYLTK
ncbi:hypothetical protein AN618_24340 [Fervidicola ferrireducens]|uniref:CARDB domain-containing protein n=1 Tax=Fervidicola ferrireducens TaxID=520764 RepID=A0A140L0B5_9FIRM|nr:hypothetical protein AN618_24340 [Fervidicola ferrireducens]